MRRFSFKVSFHNRPLFNYSHRAAGFSQYVTLKATALPSILSPEAIIVVALVYFGHLLQNISPETFIDLKMHLRRKATATRCTLAVESLHVALELPPLQADAVGELLAGLFTRLLQSLSAGVTNLLLTLRDSLMIK